MRNALALRKGPPPTGLRRTTFRFKAETVAEDGTFEGYASVFGVVDDFGDIPLPGAFRASLAEHAAAGTRPKGLWQHKPDEIINSWVSLTEDDVGLRCKGKFILDVNRAREAYAIMKAGEIDGLSIGFEPGECESCPANEVEERYAITPIWGSAGPTGTVRMMKSMTLWEISLVTFPASHRARVDGVRQAVPKRPDLTPVIAALARRQEAIGRLLA